MKKRLTNNISLKITSFIIGILVWLLVVNIDNPVQTKVITVQDVQLINETYLDESGKVCMRDEDQSPVRVSITADRKTLMKITADDVRAVADLQQAVSLSTDPVMVPITVTCNGVLPGNLKVSPQNLSIHLDEKDTQEFVVNVNSGESKPGKGYEIGVQTATPEKVRITGPKSLLSKIDKVNVNVNVEGITNDKTEEVSLRITDKNQDILSESAMNNLKIDNNGKITVSTKLWKVRSDVKIAVSYTGEPKEGYVVDSITTLPDTLSVAGSEEALETLRLDNNTIWVPQETINISDKDYDVEEKISITDFLPENIKLTSGSSEDVWVKVTILPYGSKMYTIATSDIKVKNKPKNMQVSFEVAKIEVRVQAENEEVLTLTEEDINASINLKDLEEGVHEIPVKISLPDGYELVNEVIAEIGISPISTAEERK